MKRKILALLLMALMALSMVACSPIELEPTCAASGCEETDLYEDGYCKYHYLINEGEEAIKDFVN